MGPLGKKFCLILDIDRVLSADEFLAIAESTNGEPSVQDAIAEAAITSPQAEMGT
jgi:hypothetical protein